MGTMDGEGGGVDMRKGAARLCLGVGCGLDVRCRGPECQSKLGMCHIKRHLRTSGRLERRSACTSASKSILILP